jgi:hypothetical protein
MVERGDASLVELRLMGYEDAAILELIVMVTLYWFANNVALIAQTALMCRPLHQVSLDNSGCPAAAWRSLSRR